MSTSTTKRRILFFTPYASRTGSEMMLLYILRHFDRTRYEAGLVCFARGELLNDIPSDIPVFIVPRNFNTSERIAFHLGVNPILYRLRKLAKNFKADIWYINTIMLPEVAKVAKEFSIPAITHFHELPLTYSYLEESDYRTIVDYSQLLIGCSEVTCKAIRDSGGKNVKLLYSFINEHSVEASEDRTRALRRQLGIADDDFVWVMSGTTSERKGFDLFPDIAEQLNDPKVHLVWVGSRINDGLVYYTEQRCHNSGSRTKIHLVGKQKEDYYNYLNIADGFLLTSRQDPFPLVMIEAALLGKPIAALPSGGVVEFVQEGMGLVTDDFSISKLVEAMRQVMEGEVATHPEVSQVRARQFTLASGLEGWSTLINESVGEIAVV